VREMITVIPTTYSRRDDLLSLRREIREEILKLYKIEQQIVAELLGETEHIEINIRPPRQSKGG
jgi:hypothetical protein